MPIKHGLRNHALYRVWTRMKNRCYNTNARNYKDYGGRGITICEEWKDDFKTFYDWATNNGWKSKLTIDRIDVNGNYEPSNCRFENKTIQQHNRRKWAGCSSKYTGVSFLKKKQRWTARIVKNYKSKHLGSFKTEIEAAKAYNEAAIKLYGDKANLNVIEETE